MWGRCCVVWMPVCHMGAGWSPCCSTAGLHRDWWARAGRRGWLWCLAPIPMWMSWMRFLVSSWPSPGTVAIWEVNQPLNALSSLLFCHSAFSIDEYIFKKDQGSWVGYMNFRIHWAVMRHCPTGVLLVEAVYHRRLSLLFLLFKKWF